MIIRTAEFVTSAADASGFLHTEKPVIAVSGKSNVGKSTFINMLANRNKLAKTSNTPGRTRLVNYFDFGEFVLADLPGYGFADVSKAEKKKWSGLMEIFFASVKLAHVFTLADVRHAPTSDDAQMLAYLYAYSIPFTVVATKCDKLGKSKIKPQIMSLASLLKIGADNVIAVSSTEKTGRENVLEKISHVLTLNEEKD